MTTDQMIIALVATGKFTLPAIVYRRDVGVGFWELACSVKGGGLQPQEAHDLCAMHFAREIKNVPIGGNARNKLEHSLGLATQPQP